MKKILTLIIVMTAFITVSAQWVNNPNTNTFLANTSADAGEIYLSTAPNGDIYAQWSSFVGGNGWAPTIQRINADGVPQWSNDGIHLSYHQMASWSQGFAMTATSDNAVVTCFSTEAGQTVAIRINADGTYPWGEEGITLFGNNGNSRTELLAGDDGGVWALGTDVDNGNLYVRYIEADGTLNPTITISDNSGKLCMFGLMVPTDNGIFVVYEIEQWAYTYFYEKEIWVAGYTKDGDQFGVPTQLMAAQTIGGSYTHYVVPDGLGGGYAYIWHPAIGGAFNTYVFHFDSNGVSTIVEPDGVPVHTADPDYFYFDANATVDPTTHDLLITYIETDAEFQAMNRVYVNRITTTGYKPWGDGKLVLDNGTTNCSDLLIDVVSYGYGITLIYNEGDYNSTVKAKGLDMDCDEIWNTVICSQDYPKAMCENSTGFGDGTQNIVAWVNSTNGGGGGLYGQNLGWDGSMGPNINPLPPIVSCDPPTNFQGEYVYTNNMFGAMISWDAPETTPLHYNIYFEGTKDVIEVDPENTSYFIEMEAGDYIFKLTAVYDDCESNYALTPDGEIYVIVEVTSVPENEYEEIVNVIEIYNINGQLTNTLNINDLNQGIYIIKGVTQSGKTAIRKIVK